MTVKCGVEFEHWFSLYSQFRCFQHEKNIKFGVLYQTKISYLRVLFILIHLKAGSFDGRMPILLCLISCYAISSVPLHLHDKDAQMLTCFQIYVALMERLNANNEPPFSRSQACESAVVNVGT